MIRNSIIRQGSLALQWSQLPSSGLVCCPQRAFAVRDKRKSKLFQKTDQIFNNPAEDTSPFKHDSTLELIKKLFIYKMMSTDLFINHSLRAMTFSYRLLGIRLTNLCIEKTAGSIFTGGVSVDDLCRDMDLLEKRNIGTISMMVAEGLRNVEESYLDYFHQVSKDTVKKMSEGRSEAHFATKLTVFVSMEVMERMSAAQKCFVHEILCINYADRASSSILTKQQLIDNLAKKGITTYSENDLEALVAKLSKEGVMTPIARYYGGHLFELFGEMTALEKQIAEKTGGMQPADWKKFELFKERTVSFAEYASERNTHLYVDAEQSYIQYAIESFGQ